MRSVFSRRLIAVLALVVIVLAPAAFADTGTVDPGLWTQFVAWVEGRIGVPNGATTSDDTISFEDWLVLMGRIGVPNG
jgi:hypothetical protein